MTPSQKEWTTRRAGIFALHEKGLTLAAIGEHYGITRERVRQILDKYYHIRRRALSTSRPQRIDSE